ncbi:MAG: hypothetical protein IK085_02675 [Clostridia bacterium]|nr:hypothetical protein [Clostridia bacterium]
MAVDYSFKILETFLMAKKYKNREDVLASSKFVVDVVCARFSFVFTHFSFKERKKLLLLPKNRNIIYLSIKHKERSGGL